jgi:hypothetical protein
LEKLSVKAKKQTEGSQQEHWTDVIPRAKPELLLDRKVNNNGICCYRGKALPYGIWFKTRW